MPPYLAGRKQEIEEFRKLLEQKIILENLIITGLRGIGKTVLLETLAPIAIENRWLWVGAELSQSASVSENSLVIRMLTDLSLITANITISKSSTRNFGFNVDEKRRTKERKMDLDFLIKFYESSPGLSSDKLKRTLEMAWSFIKKYPVKGLIFAYDEAQNMTDHPDKEKYPLSLLLDVFQSIQRKNIPFMLLLVGLPTLFPKLVETRTYSERMFRVLFLTSLSDKESREAIVKPLGTSKRILFSENSINMIIKASGGYPYFIQFICREVYDVFLQKITRGDNKLVVPLEEITAKLDSDFFIGRWMRATDRQRDLLAVVSELSNCNEEFTVAEVVERAKASLKKPMSASQVNQMFGSLIDSGLIYKNRYGKYSFAVPLMGEFIKRQRIGLGKNK